jgi:hypothetical protein
MFNRKNILESMARQFPFLAREIAKILAMATKNNFSQKRFHFEIL